MNIGMSVYNAEGKELFGNEKLIAMAGTPAEKKKREDINRMLKASDNAKKVYKTTKPTTEQINCEVRKLEVLEHNKKIILGWIEFYDVMQGDELSSYSNLTNKEEKCTRFLERFMGTASPYMGGELKLDEQDRYFMAAYVMSLRAPELINKKSWNENEFLNEVELRKAYIESKLSAVDDLKDVNAKRKLDNFIDKCMQVIPSELLRDVKFLNPEGVEKKMWARAVLDLVERAQENVDQVFESCSLNEINDCYNKRMVKKYTPNFSDERVDELLTKYYFDSKCLKRGEKRITKELIEQYYAREKNQQAVKAWLEAGKQKGSQVVRAEKKTGIRYRVVYVPEWKLEENLIKEKANAVSRASVLGESYSESELKTVYEGAQAVDENVLKTKEDQYKKRKMNELLMESWLVKHPEFKVAGGGKKEEEFKNIYELLAFQLNPAEIENIRIGKHRLTIHELQDVFVSYWALLKEKQKKDNLGDKKAKQVESTSNTGGFFKFLLNKVM